MQETKTRSQIGIAFMRVIKTKSRIGGKLLVLLLMIMGAMIFVAPLVHIEFSKENSSVIELRKHLDKELTSYETNILELRQEYDQGKISATDFIMENQKISNDKTEQIQLNKQILTDKINSERIFGWKTWRVFLVGLGIRLPYLLFSIIISYLIIKINSKEPNLMRAFIVLQTLCYTISFYVLIWCFWYSQDYPLHAYRFVALSISFMMALLTLFVTKHYKSTNISKLNSKIKYIMYLMINRAVNKGHIKDENKYEDDIIYPALKKLDE